MTASGLALVTAAIALWNTVYLDRRPHAGDSQGRQWPAADRDGRTHLVVAALSTGLGLGRVVPAAGPGRTGRPRRIAIVALARKLLVALWRYVTAGVIPEGAVLKEV